MINHKQILLTKKTMIQSSQQGYKNFLKTFETLSYKHSYSDTFSNFLDFALYMLTPIKTEEDKEVMQRLENTYTDKKEGQLMAELFLNFTDAADNDGEGFYDVLGDLFMELISHGRNGQFFTPQPVCDMMAAMTYGDDLADGKTVCDPACGSGRMLMAVAKMNRNLTFYGADNDSTCCKMAVLNMVLNTLPGEIAWMNSLSMEHYKSWHIKRILSGTHYVPYLFTTGKNQTGFFDVKEKVIAEIEKKEFAAVIQIQKTEQLSIF